MSPNTASPTRRPRIWVSIPAGFVLALAVWALGTGLDFDRNGPRVASASFSPQGEAQQDFTERSVKKQYALALADYYAGEYLRAKELFAGIASHVPGYLSDDIQFWRAECAFRLGDTKSAESGFKMFLKQGSHGSPYRNRPEQVIRPEVASN